MQEGKGVSYLYLWFFLSQYSLPLSYHNVKKDGPGLSCCQQIAQQPPSVPQPQLSSMRLRKTCQHIAALAKGCGQPYDSAFFVIRR